jgi:hypothetical protein
MHQFQLPRQLEEFEKTFVVNLDPFHRDDIASQFDNYRRVMSTLAIMIVHGEAVPLASLTLFYLHPCFLARE